jgi:hypothetical protein
MQPKAKRSWSSMPGSARKRSTNQNLSHAVFPR